MVTLLRLFSLFLMRTFAQIGPVGNSEDFQTAYGCPADSAMNRHKHKLKPNPLHIVIKGKGFHLTFLRGDDKCLLW